MDDQWRRSCKRNLTNKSLYKSMQKSARVSWHKYYKGAMADKKTKTKEAAFP